MGTMPGRGPIAKQTAERTCKVCREKKEHYRWNDRALWTCIDVNSHPDVTDIRVLQARIVELEDDNMVLRGKIGAALALAKPHEHLTDALLSRIQRLLEAIAKLTDDNMPTLHAHHQTGIVGWGWNAHVKNESGHQAAYGGSLGSVEAMLRKELARHQELEHTQPTLTEGMKHAEDIRSGVEQGAGPGSVDDGADQGG